MKQFISILLLGLLAFGTADASAQVRALRANEVQALTVDTVTNSGTVTFTIPRYNPGIGALSWHLEVLNLTGTTRGTATLQYSNDLAGANWEVAKIYAISGAGDTIFTDPLFTAARFRLQVVGDTTQSTEVRSFVKWVQRE